MKDKLEFSKYYFFQMNIKEGLFLSVFGLLLICCFPLFGQLDVEMDNGKGGNTYYEGEVISYSFKLKNISINSVPYKKSTDFAGLMCNFRILDLQTGEELYFADHLKDWKLYKLGDSIPSGMGFWPPDTNLGPNNFLIGNSWIGPTQAGNKGLREYSNRYTDLPENNEFRIFKNALSYPYFFKPGKYKLTYLLLNIPYANDIKKDYEFVVKPTFGKRKIDFHEYLDALYQCFSENYKYDSLSFARLREFENYPYWKILKNNPNTYYASELIEAHSSISMGNMVQLGFEGHLEAEFYIFDQIPNLKNLRKTPYVLFYIELTFKRLCRNANFENIINMPKKKYFQEYLERLRSHDPEYSKIIIDNAKKFGIDGLLDYSQKLK